MSDPVKMLRKLREAHRRGEISITAYSWMEAAHLKHLDTGQTVDELESLKAKGTSRPARYRVLKAEMHEELKIVLRECGDPEPWSDGLWNVAVLLDDFKSLWRVSRGDDMALRDVWSGVSKTHRIDNPILGDAVMAAFSKCRPFQKGGPDLPVSHERLSELVTQLRIVAFGQKDESVSHSENENTKHELRVVDGRKR